VKKKSVSVDSTKKTRNSSGDEIANVNFLYDDIVHAPQNTIIIIIIIIKAICNAQDPLKKAANVLSGSLKMLVSIYNVSCKQQCLQLCPKGRETTVRLVSTIDSCINSTAKQRGCVGMQVYQIQGNNAM